MNKKYVTSLNLSKQLKEAGIPQKSDFVWDLRFQGIYESYVVIPSYEKSIHLDVRCSAFHVGELMEMLPKELPDIQNRRPFLMITKDIWPEGDAYAVDYVIATYDKSILSYYLMQKEQSFAEAMGKMLLYLKKESLI